MTGVGIRTRGSSIPLRRLSMVVYPRTVLSITNKKKPQIVINMYNELYIFVIISVPINPPTVFFVILT